MKDRIIIRKIQDYINRIEPIYHTIKDLDEDALLELNDSYALTQFLTNINGLFENITSDKIAEKHIKMGIRSLRICRNISSQDNDSLDWNKVKKVCAKLVSPSTKKTLEDCYKIAEEEEKSVKDYSNL